MAPLLRILLLCLLLACACGGAAEQRAPAVAVLFPDVGGVYRGVYDSILEGIDDGSQGKSIAVPIGSSTNIAALQAELRRQDVRLVIALGRNSIRAGVAMEAEFKLIAGGVLSLPEAELRALHVRSLATDPAALFVRLKAIMPRAKRIHVVYEPVQNAWLIRHAQRAAKQLGIELMAHEAANIQAAMQHYQAILAGMDPAHDALWLPQDAVTVQDSVVLPLVLRSAWTGSLAVFSSTLGHVRQGVLFSLYPDNPAYGRQLGALARAALSGASPPEAGISPLRELHSALNVSTLNHLQIPLSSRQIKEFNMTFPEN